MQFSNPTLLLALVSLATALPQGTTGRNAAWVCTAKYWSGDCQHIIGDSCVPLTGIYDHALLSARSEPGFTCQLYLTSNCVSPSSSRSVPIPSSVEVAHPLELPDLEPVNFGRMAGSIRCVSQTVRRSEGRTTDEAGSRKWYDFGERL